MSNALLMAAQVGRIEGGWNYVWTAYGITSAALILYTLSLWLRRPSKES